MNSPLIAILGLIISIVAIVVSVGTAWFNIFHRGTVKMARPHFFALLPEDSPFGGWLKFFMRTLLFSTGKRGRVIESIYVDLEHDGIIFPFHYWMYGEAKELKIGSGIFVGPDGIGANHHFVPTAPLSIKDLTPGKYELSVRVSLLGDGSPVHLGNISFELGKEEATALTTRKDKAIFYIWDISGQKYKSRIDTRRSGREAFSLDLS